MRRGKMKRLNFIHLGVTLTGLFILLNVFTRGKGIVWLGVGAILIGVGSYNVIIKAREAVNQAYKKTNQIDDIDERNKLIKIKAKAVTYDITLFAINLCILYYLLNDKTGMVIVLIGIVILQLLTYETSKMHYNKIL
jgi:ABC-type protease/lipase transport system fused ATPase/permease subunit